MDTEYDRDRGEQLKRGLYKPNNEHKLERNIPKLSQSRIDVESDWRGTEIDGSHEKRIYAWTTGLAKKLLFVALLAIFGSGSYLLYQYFDPLEQPSDKNIVVTIDTPVAVTPGVPQEIVIQVTNNNRVPLDYANLTVIFPQGSRDSGDASKDLREQQKVLGIIQPGETVEYKTRTIFLGEEGEEKIVGAKIEYRFERMNSTFTKDSERPVRMLSAPINLTVTTLKEVNAGQQIEVSVNAVSNTVIPLRDIFIKMEYPQGFIYGGAEPKPSFGNNIWRVGTLTPSSKFPIKIQGVLGGVDADKRVFRTMVGVGSDKTERDIAILYGQAITELSVKRPFIGIGLTINDKPAGDALAYYGKKSKGVVTFKNNLSSPITNAQIEVRITGVALNRSSVSASNEGFYQSIDKTIYWKSSTGNTVLAELSAGESGTVEFSFEPLPPDSGNKLITNPIITAEVTVRGRRMSESNVPEEIKTVVAQNVKIVSDVQFVTRSLYYSGPFINSGPIPPKVEVDTTYTVIWGVVNSSNGLSSARVRGILPTYMQWYGSVSPSKEKIFYNKSTNEIIWEPGEIPAGTGLGGMPPKEVAFQLVLTPSISQVSSAPSFISNQVFTAVDSFTNTEVSIKGREVSSYLSTDPLAPLENRLVVP